MVKVNVKVKVDVPFALDGGQASRREEVIFQARKLRELAETLNKGKRKAKDESCGKQIL
jgi:hypothetical protein